MISVGGGVERAGWHIENAGSEVVVVQVNSEQRVGRRRESCEMEERKEEIRRSDFGFDL